MTDLLYVLSLCIVIGVCGGAVLHPRVPTGIVGAIALAGVAVFSATGIEHDPDSWHVGQTVSEAILALWVWGRWEWRRMRIRERLIQVCQACPLHEDNP